MTDHGTHTSPSHSQPSQPLLLLSSLNRGHHKKDVQLSIGISIALNILCIVTVSYYLKSDGWIKPKQNIVVTDLFDALDGGRTKRNSDVVHQQTRSLDGSPMSLAPVEIKADANHQKLSPIKTQDKQTPATLKKAKATRKWKPKRRQIINERGQAKDRYMHRVRNQIYKSFPTLDQTKITDINDSVILKVIIQTSTGKLKKIEYVKRSKSWVLNEAAMIAVKRATPFPPFNTDLGDWPFIIPFSLKQKH